jgi:hypothetical protein
MHQADRHGLCLADRAKVTRQAVTRLASAQGLSAPRKVGRLGPKGKVPALPYHSLEVYLCAGERRGQVAYLYEEGQHCGFPQSKPRASLKLCTSSFRIKVHIVHFYL